MTPTQLEYRDIPGFPGYKACSNGKIFGLKGFFLSPSVTKLNYERVTLRVGPPGATEPKTMTVHSLICSAFHGERPSPKMQTRHWDGNRRNNLPDNLLWGTWKDNYEDQVRHGRGLDGAGNPNHKLSVDDISKIRERLSKGENAKIIAKEFGVVFQSIYNIKTSITWKR